MPERFQTRIVRLGDDLIAEIPRPVAIELGLVDGEKVEISIRTVRDDYGILRGIGRVEPADHAEHE